MDLEPNSLDWNGNELEHKLELEDMKRTRVMEIETTDSLPTFFLKKGTTVHED